MNAEIDFLAKVDSREVYEEAKEVVINFPALEVIAERLALEKDFIPGL